MIMHVLITQQFYLKKKTYTIIFILLSLPQIPNSLKFSLLFSDFKIGYPCIHNHRSFSHDILKTEPIQSVEIDDYLRKSQTSIIRNPIYYQSLSYFWVILEKQELVCCRFGEFCGFRGF
ncbi:hypothetical protein HanRHA438_Chr11g0493141 [Helianthus annuus]|uniref:Uncharacterized protein n=1 Tax=Helianthus annuus TaxID=4232 RepID=A0A251TAT7_HELAN|nr:hypothetical protein HanXRQr2_Chr11g0479891 [Helianthus annuus]KAJ0500800.1 hypothetical protein HanHA300_Chr11g0393471 [Helianthus annuus]KAJ0516671.1 hypothetical protein HanHA89_Chr11g0416441 [Helianthus annuus]KAJ0684674.1 hypothetical protein HanLR1_Chr11g0393831 [Helianthus annuus]KAJ0688619.1 hypothetical protein HanOQP8_Chr11g0396321 [Helianthus annuus]